jgi:glutathione S-transferase
MLTRHEIININLVKKPTWFLEKNPTGTLPVLEHEDGRLLHESLIICDYLDTLYADTPLRPTDPYLRARHSLIVDNFSRVTAAYYKVLRANTPESLNDLNKAYEYFEKYLITEYFGGFLI